MCLLLLGGYSTSILYSVWLHMYPFKFQMAAVINTQLTLPLLQSVEAGIAPATDFGSDSHHCSAHKYRCYHNCFH